MEDSELANGGNAYNTLPPDIVEETLPFLSSEDIKSLSNTNKYFHKLLNYGSSDTLWHELFRKAYGNPHTNDEPFQPKESEQARTCCEVIMAEKFTDLSWRDMFRLRTRQAHLYTWGCVKHARLGYTAGSHGSISANAMNAVGLRQLYFGVNKPTKVPWYPDNDSTEDACVVQVSSGGFSFQILTKSGKLYSTGSTFTGGHKGPGPADGQHDYNPFREAIYEMERSGPRFGGLNRTFNTTGVFPQVPHISTSAPHANIYQELEDMERNATQTIPNNEHIRRMFTRECFDFFTSEENSLKVDQEKLNSIKYISVSSGRSHFLALSSNNQIYSWDSPDSDYGIRIEFEGLPSRSISPVLKIGCGWDLNCVYLYNVGLVVWNKRHPSNKGESTSNAIYEIIPGTGHINGPKKVIDFACFQSDCIFFVTNDESKLWRFSRGITTSLNIPIEGRIMKMSVCFTSLVLFTEAHCYTINITNGDLEIPSLTKLDLPDPDDAIISLACGDYHTIALTQKGQIYSWGLESQLCGCLGLGSPEQVIEQEHNGRWDGLRNMRVEKPTKIDLDKNYTCVGVCAGGWQSGALIIEK